MSSDKNSHEQISSNKKQQTPLKMAIQARISSNKRFFSTQAYDSQSKQALSEIQPADNRREIQNNNQLMSLVSEYQSKKYNGFYEYNNWIIFCENSFPHVTRDVVQQFYKILRIINYGQVLLPTGLVFELSQLFSRRYPANKSIEQILDHFLRFNNKPDRTINFRQIRNYRSLVEIQSIFRQPFQKKKQIVNLFKPLQQNSKDVYQRNYKQSKLRNYASTKILCKNIASQVNSCTFKPVISKFNSQRKKENSNQNRKPQRICQHKQQWKFKQQQPLEEYKFKAKGFNSTHFEANILGIPGVQEHLIRKKYVQAEKQRLQRHIIKPVLLKKPKSPGKTIIDFQQ